MSKCEALCEHEWNPITLYCKKCSCPMRRAASRQTKYESWLSHEKVVEDAGSEATAIAAFDYVMGHVDEPPDYRAIREKLRQDELDASRKRRTAHQAAFKQRLAAMSRPRRSMIQSL